MGVLMKVRTTKFNSLIVNDVEINSLSDCVKAAYSTLKIPQTLKVIVNPFNIVFYDAKGNILKDKHYDEQVVVDRSHEATVTLIDRLAVDILTMEDKSKSA